MALHVHHIPNLGINDELRALFSLRVSFSSGCCVQLALLITGEIHIFAVFQANKGIYVDKTPTEAGVERAYLMHALAHGLKHRSRLEELAQKGVYLEVRPPAM